MKWFDASRHSRSGWWISINFPAWTQFRNNFHASLQTLAHILHVGFIGEWMSYGCLLTCSIAAILVVVVGGSFQSCSSELSFSTQAKLALCAAPKLHDCASLHACVSTRVLPGWGGGAGPDQQCSSGAIRTPHLYPATAVDSFKGRAAQTI